MNVRLATSRSLAISFSVFVTVALLGCETPPKADAYGTGIYPSRLNWNISAKKADVWRHRTAISAITRIEDDKCGRSLSLFRNQEGQDEEALSSFAMGSVCEASNDGLESPSGNGNALINLAPVDSSLSSWSYERFSTQTLTSTPDSELLDLAGTLMDTANRFDPAELDELTLQCEYRCASVVLIAIHFAKANYFDSVDRSMTGAVWRLQGLKYALHSSAIREAHSDALVSHMKLAYVTADMQEDSRVAHWLIDEWQLHLSSEHKIPNEFKDHLEAWDVGLEQRTRASGYTFPLIMDTPFSDYLAVGYRGIASREFKIEVLAGAINYAFLECGEWLLGSHNTQVELRTYLKRGWKIPADWDDCGVIIIGQQGSKVRIWEYLDGSLDENGNLSA